MVAVGEGRGGGPARGSVTGPSVADPLLARLGSRWERACAGHAVRVAICGGAGAASLIDAFVADAVRGGDVVTVTARTGGLPGAFVDRLLRALDLPTLTREGTAASLRARVLDALLERRTSRPLLIVVLDLHLIDELSEVLLVQVLGRLRDAPVMVVVATGAGELGPRWRRLFPGGPDDDTLRLEALDRAEARRQIGRAHV